MLSWCVQLSSHGTGARSPTPWQEAWRTLEELYAEGKVRAIGVSNFSDHLLRELLAMARVVPAIVQNWMDPFHQDREARSFCAEKGAPMALGLFPDVFRRR